MKLEYPPELSKLLQSNENLEVLVVAVVFDKTKPMTKRFRRELAHNAYESALKQLETLIQKVPK